MVVESIAYLTKNHLNKSMSGRTLWYLEHVLLEPLSPHCCKAGASPGTHGKKG